MKRSNGPKKKKIEPESESIRRRSMWYNRCAKYGDLTSAIIILYKYYFLYIYITI